MNQEAYRAGYVRRWHTHPFYKQTVAEHSWGAAMIIISECPNPSANLLKAALIHDLHEAMIGDITPAGKTILNIREKEEAYKLQWLKELKIEWPPLTDEEKWWLEYADKGEATLFTSWQLGQHHIDRSMLRDLVANIAEIIAKGQKL